MHQALQMIQLTHQAEASTEVLSIGGRLLKPFLKRGSGQKRLRCVSGTGLKE